MSLLSRDKSPASAPPDLGSYSEQEWQDARRQRAWQVVCRGVRDRLSQDLSRRLATLEDPDERARVKRHYSSLEEPFTAPAPPAEWATPRESVVERRIGASMTTPAELELREIRERTGKRYRVLLPGDKQPRPKGYGPNEKV